jgi:hypothetical protein
MEQWLSALEPLALRNHWRLKTFLRSACPLLHVRVADKADREDTGCEKTNKLRFAAGPVGPIWNRNRCGGVAEQ